MPIRVGLISLGCAKNLVDSEIMLGTLARDRVEITNDTALADVVIVNTCSFIDSAQEESVDTILESAQVREAQHRGQAVVVAGCLPQRFRSELPKLMPEIDAFMGLDQVAEVTQVVRQALEHRQQRLAAPPPGRAKKAAGASRPGKASAARPAPPGAAPPVVQISERSAYIPDYTTPRFKLTPRHLTYIKIAEGCNHPCSFCIIPQIRGSHRSRPPGDVVQEARHWLEMGVKELNLISQDTTFYGLDLRPDRQGSVASPEKFTAATRALPKTSATLASLVRELNALPGDFWIRLLYTHPAHWTGELISAIAECPKVARYVDMPLQHIHPVMLERMRRETSREYIEDLIGKIRRGIPGIALRTTFIVGFPGETEAGFESLKQFVEQTRFERLGVFTFSPEQGTRAAAMAQQIPEAVRKKRRDALMGAQLKISRQLAGAQVGKTLKVLVEHPASPAELQGARIGSWEHGLLRGPDRHRQGLQGNFLVARAEADAPDIDGRVYIQGDPPLGQFARVQIVGHTDYDLIAKPA